jgi:hypothetical protein
VLTVGVADGTAIGWLLGRARAARVGTGSWARSGVDGSAGVVAGVGALELLRGRGCFVGAGVALRVADGVGVGVAVGVAEGVGEGVAVGVDEGAGGGVVLGEPVGDADGDGAAVEPDGDGLGAGAAVAGSTRATVEAVIAAPGWALAFTLAVLADTVADAAAAAPDEHAITTAAPAVNAPRTVMTRQFARSAVADRAGSPCLPEPADIRPPCLDHPDIQCERELNPYIVREPGKDGHIALESVIDVRRLGG